MDFAASKNSNEITHFKLYIIDFLNFCEHWIIIIKWNLSNEKQIPQVTRY